jgi:hypothetical protein
LEVAVVATTPEIGLNDEGKLKRGWRALLEQRPAGGPGQEVSPMAKTGFHSTTSPDLRAQFLPLLDPVNELIAQLAAVAADPEATWQEQAHRQLVLLAAFAEITAGGQVAAHVPMRRYLAKLEQLVVRRQVERKKCGRQAK